MLETCLRNPKISSSIIGGKLVEGFLCVLGFPDSSLQNAYRAELNACVTGAVRLMNVTKHVCVCAHVGLWHHSQEHAELHASQLPSNPLSSLLEVQLGRC